MKRRRILEPRARFRGRLRDFARRPFLAVDKSGERAPKLVVAQHFRLAEKQRTVSGGSMTFYSSAVSAASFGLLS